MRGIIGGLALVSVFLSAADPVQAAEEFSFTSESALFNPATGQVHFTIEFNQDPDFLTVDEFNRQRHSFQYYIIGNPVLDYPGFYDSIIRAEELHVDPSVLRVRDPRPSAPDPAAGGWGAIRGEVPFSLAGNVLTFSVPLGLISDHSEDGRFAYQLGAFEYGGTTRWVESVSNPVPEPSTWAMMLLGFAAAGHSLRRQKRSKALAQLA